MKFSLFFFCFLIASCAASARDIRPHQSAFAQVQSTVELKILECNEKTKECSLKSMGIKVAFGSGSFFSYKNNTAFISAAHVCLGPAYGIWNDIPEKSQVSTEILLNSYTGKELKGEIKYINLKYDLCIIEVEKTINIKRIPKVSVLKPTLNQKHYSIAAPYSIFHVGMVPIKEGRYFGDHKIFSFFGIPTGPGASGAPVFNQNDMIVGLIQRTHLQFNHISLSIKHKDMIDCLDSYLDAKKREIDILIE